MLQRYSHSLGPEEPEVATSPQVGVFLSHSSEELSTLPKADPFSLSVSLEARNASL